MTLFPETRGSLLVALKSDDDRAAWHQFVCLYRPVFYRMARRRGLQDADASDLVQQVLMKISRAMADFEHRPDVRFRHWLRRIANNAIATALTRTFPDAAVGGSQSDLPCDRAVSAEISQEIEAEYERELYLTAAAAVRTEVCSETWQAFELTMIDDLTCEAAAARLNKSVGTIYAARSRIVRRLRSHIEQLQKNEE